MALVFTIAFFGLLVPKIIAPSELFYFGLQLTRLETALSISSLKHSPLLELVHPHFCIANQKK
jgi:hypothetical protein